MDPIRIIYHPAPAPSSDGRAVEVPPIDLGSDPAFALAWIRRRLNLPAVAVDAPLRFSAEIIPLPEPIEVEQALETLATTPPGETAAHPKSIKSATPRRTRLGRKATPGSSVTSASGDPVAADMSAGLASSVADSLFAIPDLYDETFLSAAPDSSPAAATSDQPIAESPTPGEDRSVFEGSTP